MVKGNIIGAQKYYVCEECSLLYAEKEWAKKCEEWCAKNKSCNLEITAHRIKGGEYNGQRSDLRDGS